jgi:hypothetical protein
LLAVGPDPSQSRAMLRSVSSVLGPGGAAVCDDARSQLSLL